MNLDHGLSPTSHVQHEASAQKDPISGTRRLVNVWSENIAFLPDANSASDIVGTPIEGKPGEEVRHQRRHYPSS